MTQAKTKEDSLELVKEWIRSSGIQSDRGGFYSWHDLTDKSYPYLYSEITGYGITTLLFLHRLTGDKGFVDKARKAASWIIGSAMHACGGVRTRLYNQDQGSDRLYSFAGENIFSFDTGMVLYGMISLYKATKEEEFLKASVRMGGFILDRMQKKDGSLYPIYNTKEDKMIEPNDKWSNQSGGFHCKVSLGLVELFRVTEEERYHDAAIRLCRYALSTQEPNGRFITDKGSPTTHIHSYSYTTEGLWYTGRSLGVSEFIDSAERATEWAFENVSSTGINELYEPSTETFNDFQRSDILAQVLRMGLIYSIKDKTEELKSALLSYQYLGDDLSQRGGFLYSRGSQHLNSWCSMFALQALAFYNKRELVSDSKKDILLI